MIGQGKAAIGAAIQLYLGVEHELKGKSTHELETLVQHLTPGVNRDNTLFFGGLVTFLGAAAGSIIAEQIPELKENSYMGLTYVGLPSLLATVIYGFVNMGSSWGLESRYRRDAAQSILEKRRKEAHSA